MWRLLRDFNHFFTWLMQSAHRVHHVFDIASGALPLVTNSFSQCLLLPSTFTFPTFTTAPRPWFPLFVVPVYWFFCEVRLFTSLVIQRCASKLHSGACPVLGRAFLPVVIYDLVVQSQCQL